MSNKLTREVRYLSESDRPKKVEPLSFSNWCASVYNVDVFKITTMSTMDEFAKSYATYLQEFSAEEVGVVFTGYLNPILGKANPLRSVSEFTDVTYLGKDSSYGDVFSVKDCQCILIYYGHLHSGKF